MTDDGCELLVLVLVLVFEKHDSENDDENDDDDEQLTFVIRHSPVTRRTGSRAR